MEVAAEIDHENRRADKDRRADHEPRWKAGIDDAIENAHQKRAAGGLDACANLQPIFRHGERARRPGNQLDDDGVDQGSDVQSAQDGVAARERPTEQHPATPKQMKEKDGFREDRCGKNGSAAPLGPGWRISLYAPTCVRARLGRRGRRFMVSVLDW